MPAKEGPSRVCHSNITERTVATTSLPRRCRAFTAGRTPICLLDLAEVEYMPLFQDVSQGGIPTRSVVLHMPRRRRCQRHKHQNPNMSRTLARKPKARVRPMRPKNQSSRQAKLANRVLSKKLLTRHDWHDFSCHSCLNVKHG